tara:strand:- start:1358 stop:2257 length:900 start_codon:yes stop_codon:yes gene_type:complete
MRDVLILGTVALDTIETPFGKAEDALGGSASYASFSASFFVKPAIISVIGEDYPEEYLELLKGKGIDLGSVTKADKTFRWSGSYEYDMNEANTLSTELNSLATYKPEVKEEYKDAKYIFLANIDPEVQKSVIEQLNNPTLIVMDTMNFWIESKKKELLDVIGQVDVLILNEGEARQLFETPNLMTAANKALKLGLKSVIIKKGEHGALMYMNGKHFNAPGYPLETVKDPTGAGDTFGGAFTGYLAKSGDLSEENFRKAIVYGCALASFNAEDFSLNNLNKIKMEDIDERFKHMKEIREF